VSRIRSSPDFAASSEANFGFTRGASNKKPEFGARKTFVAENAPNGSKADKGRKPMISHTRRDLMRGAALVGASLAAGAAIAAPAKLSLNDIKKQANVACLYHCDFGDLDRFNQMLNNISNHYSVYDADPFEIEIVIVAHGPGVKFFLSTFDNTLWKNETIPADVFARVESLSKNGLRVFLCDITFTKNKLDREKVHAGDFMSFVPSGVAAVAALQGKGFAYLKVA
jgi:intracellular sulfur oxidation DsrE/DsrF family protein